VRTHTPNSFTEMRRSSVPRMKQPTPAPTPTPKVHPFIATLAEMHNVMNALCDIESNKGPLKTE
jgi:hypothetical protein